MAGLNDDVEDGLDVNHDDLIVPPAPDTPVRKLDIITPVDNPIPTHVITANDLFGPILLPGELPNISAQINLISDRSAKLIDLKEIECEIANRASVCQEDARMIDERYGGLLTDELPIGTYSVIPSRSNYDHVLHHIRRIISTESIDISNAVSIVDDTYTAFRSFCDQLTIVYIPMINSQLGLIKGSLQGDMDKISVSGNVVYPCDDSFLNVLRDPIQTLVTRWPRVNISVTSAPTTAHQWSRKDYDAFTQSLQNIAYLIDNLSMSFFISRIIDGKQFTMIMEYDRPVIEEYIKTINLADLLSIYTNPNTVSHYESLSSYIDMTINEYCELREHLSNPADYIKNIHQYIERHHYADDVIKYSIMMNYAMYSVITILSNHV